MTGNEPPRSAAWLMRVLAPERDKETILGDLIEERAMLARSHSPLKASLWFWEQVLRSVGPVIWANIRRRRWLNKLGAGAVVYIAMVIFTISEELVTSKPAYYAPTTLVVGFSAMAVAGYMADHLRSGAAIVLAIMSAAAGVNLLAKNWGGAGMWFQIAITVTGPVACMAGARLAQRRRRKSNAGLDR